MQEQLAAKQLEVDQLQQQVDALTNERAASAQQIAALQAEADNAAAAAPAHNGGDHDMAAGDEQVAPNGAAAVNPAQMTIPEIKEWLTDAGFEGEVWELVNRKTPRVKKDDWVQLARSKQAA